MTEFEILPPRVISQTLDTPEGSLHYMDVGEGPPLLLIHSFGPQPGVTAWLIYKEVLADLSSARRCIALDMPNFGLSGPVEYDEPFHDVVVRAAVRLLDHLALEQVPVVGSSMGATVALDLSIQFPERVSGLVVGSCHASTGGDPYLLAPFPSEVQRLFDEAQLNPSDIGMTRRLLAALVYDESVLTDEMVGAIQGLRESRLDHWEAVVRSTSRPHSNLDVLAAVDVPMKVIHGRFDRMVPFEQALMIASYVRQADVTILNGCGHWPPFERPSTFSSLVREWLNRARL